MLRRTAARAFGEPEGGEATEKRSSGPGRSILPAGGESLRRDRVLDRLFEDLHDGLQERLRRLRPAGGDPGPPDSAPPLPRLTRPRPRLEGLEFRLEGPRGEIHVTHSLRGFLRVSGMAREAGDAPGPLQGREPGLDELVSVERQGGEYRPIVKPFVQRSAGWGRGGERPRAGFRFTSVPELVDRYVSLVAPPSGPQTISNVDTFWNVP